MAEFNKFEEKLDKVQEDVNEIKIILARNTASLEEHMKRTAIAEQRIEMVQEHMSEQIAPIRAHVTMVNTALKVLGALGAILLFLNELGILKSIFN
jgi:DNA repair ATPase RecN